KRRPYASYYYINRHNRDAMLLAFLYFIGSMRYNRFRDSSALDISQSEVGIVSGSCMLAHSAPF
ncbi:hypothetical protein, partial [Marinagarivorans algicola]|uniref:hypothetical protein n=1 Tax=Marinagarivorans algicola TaxID=1513270 RepID=UPI001C119A16